MREAPSEVMQGRFLLNYFGRTLNEMVKLLGRKTITRRLCVPATPYSAGNYSLGKPNCCSISSYSDIFTLCMVDLYH